MSMMISIMARDYSMALPLRRVHGGGSPLLYGIFREWIFLMLAMHDQAMDINDLREMFTLDYHVLGSGMRLHQPH